jgi:hypothetical protein
LKELLASELINVTGRRFCSSEGVGLKASDSRREKKEKENKDTNRKI